MANELILRNGFISLIGGTITGSLSLDNITINNLTTDTSNTALVLGAGNVVKTRNLTTFVDSLGLVSGSSQITYNQITGIPGGIVSGSTQIVPLLPTGVVSGSNQISSSIDLQSVLEAGYFAVGATGNQLVLDPGLNPSLGGSIFGEFEKTGDKSYLSADPTEFVSYVSGGNGIAELTIIENYISLAHTTTAGSSTFYVIDPKASNVGFILNTPTGTAASTNYYIPLSVNGTFADIDGAILISGLISGSSQLTSSLATNFVTLNTSQTISAQKTFTNGIVANNSGSGNAYISTNTGTGQGILVYNQSSGTGIWASNNNAAGDAIIIDNSSAGGNGLYVDNNGTNGKGIYVKNDDTAEGIYVSNLSTGQGVVSDSTNASGFNFVGRSSGVTKFSVNRAGNVSGSSFIKSGASSDDILLGDGSTTSLSSLSPSSISGLVSGSSQIDHDQTTNFVANEHIDWTTDQGATDIHSGNYINTTYNHLAVTTTGGAFLRLNGSDASNDDVKFANGTNVTVAFTDANTITINSTDQFVGTVTSVTAGDGMTQTGTSTVNPTLNIVSHAGSAGTIGTINIGADAIGVNLGTTSTTAAAGNHTHSTLYEPIASGTHTLVSGSSQITYSGITGIPSGIVSSSFVAYTNVDNNFSVSQTISGDLTVTGIVTAQEFHTEFISASIIYQSGSTKFGDTGDDTHEFTGSLSLSGSLLLNSLLNQASEATALMINGSNIVGTRELGSNAFTSTTYDNYVSWTLAGNSGTNQTISSTNTALISGSHGITAIGENTDRLNLRHTNNITAGSAQGGSGILSGGGSFTVPTITYDSNGHITTWSTNSYTLPSSLTPGFEPIDEGNGIGIVIVGRTASLYGNVGLGAVDASNSTVSGSIHGATGDFAAAFGQNTEASGDRSFAVGEYTNATGPISTAFGGFNTSSGIQSFTVGYGNIASNIDAFAIGRTTVASGYHTFAGGSNNTSPSYAEFVIGHFSTTYTPTSETSISATDRVFNIGNGTSTGARSDAFTILKNGYIGIGYDNFETTNGTDILQVNGAISASAFKGDGSGLTGLTETSIPIATSTTSGSVKLFSDTVQSVAATAVSTTASRTYGSQFNSTGQLVVNVPWVNTGVTTMAAIGSTPNANGASISTTPFNTLTLQPASATFGGVLSNTTQSITGSKQFITDIKIGAAAENTSVKLEYQKNAAVTTGGARDIATISMTNKIGSIIDYGVVNGTNSRMGQLMVVWNGANTQFTDNSTLDIGDTSGVVFSAVQVSTNMVIRATTTTSTWDIRTHVRTL